MGSSLLGKRLQLFRAVVRAWAEGWQGKQEEMAGERTKLEWRGERREEAGGGEEEAKGWG